MLETGRRPGTREDRFPKESGRRNVPLLRIRYGTSRPVREGASPVELVLPLDDAAADLVAVGGKGASLARLARAGVSTVCSGSATVVMTNN